MAKSSKNLVLASALVLGSLASTPASASCDPSSYLGSVCIVGFNFCPRGYLDADGRLLQIASYNALFSLYGTMYGGDGESTFGLPDLRGRVPVGASFSAPGLTRIREGEKGGQEAVNLGIPQMPAHHHDVKLLGTVRRGDTDKPTGAVPARRPRSNIYSTDGAVAPMHASAVSESSVGTSQAVNLRDPFVGVRYCIASQGLYPPRD